MKSHSVRLSLGVCVLGLAHWAALAQPARYQLVSALGSSQRPSATANGDSVAPVISHDGRYVVFASTANNLLPLVPGQAKPGQLIPPLNSFVRDRVTGTITLVSVNAAGNGSGDGDSIPVDISPDGRFVLFQSTAGNLVGNDSNGCSDVFVRDLQNQTTILVSLGINGVSGNGASRSPSMTPDGRYVAFASSATDLVPGDTNKIEDIFVRDLGSNTTTLVSTGAIAVPGSLSGSEAPEITLDGRFVVFYSAATNLVPDVPVGGDIYLRDLQNQTTVWASAGARAGFQSITGSTNTVCYNHRVSEDGQYVAYQASDRSVLGANGCGVIFRYQVSSGGTELIYTNAVAVLSIPEEACSLDLTPDGQFIAFTANSIKPGTTNSSVLVWGAASGTIVPASVDLSGQSATNGASYQPTIDPSGRYVSFLSSASNLVTNELPGGFHLFRRDLLSAATVLIDSSTNGLPVTLGPDSAPLVSDDGQFLAFKGPDSDLVPNDRNRRDDVFLTDLSATSVNLVSARDPGLASVTPNGASLLSLSSVSYDGSYIAFVSEAENLAPNDTNHCRDVFVRDMAGDGCALVSVATNGMSGDLPSLEPAISGDGRYVAFTSWADNLVPGDNNRTSDVFLRDIVSGSTTCVSINEDNTATGNNASSAPLVSSDGRYVLFKSAASDLVPSGNSLNLFLRDMIAGTNYSPATGSPIGNVAMTPDARFVLYVLNLSSTVRVWSRLSLSNIFSYTIGGSSSFSLPSVASSSNGRRIAYGGNGYLQAADPITGTRTVLSSSAGNYYSNLRLTADGRLLLYSWQASSRSFPQIYLFDLVALTNKLLSARFDGSAPGNGNSDYGDISADGRFVAFRSSARDIIQSDPNGLANIFLVDLQTGTTTLLSAGPAGGFPDNTSLAPVFSGDGRVLLFQSLANDLITHDFNTGSDIFAFPFLYASISFDIGGQPTPRISWPCIPGTVYQVQYKNSVGDTGWQTLAEPYSIVGNRAFVTDPTSAVQAGDRVYRVIVSDGAPIQFGGQKQ